MAPSPYPVPLAVESKAYQRYIRRHSHDLGNCLSAMDLQAILLQRGGVTAEADATLTVIRKQIGCISEMQLRLGLRFRTPAFSVISLNCCLDECRSRSRIVSAENPLVWISADRDCWFRGDPQAVSVMMVEIADHWFAHCDGTINGYAREGNICLQMQRNVTARPAQTVPPMDPEVHDELAWLVTYYGGTLVGGVAGPELMVRFPQALTVQP
jgi:hypothetical protein